MLKNGDFIYLYHDDKSTFMIPYREGFSFSTHKGEIKLTEGLSYGDAIKTNSGEIFYILRPALSDYMMKVKRRTTIIYPKEAGIIVLELGISYGKRVIEIGTGSGSLTILLSNLVGDKGKVYSFERNAERLENAIKNVKRFCTAENVEFFCKDPVLESGFGLEDIDSLFIDVPEPWKIIPFAHKALMGGGTIGVLSPNIEQIQATAEAMEKNGFVRLRCMEVFTRGIRVKKFLTRPFDRMIGHTGYLLFAHKINHRTEKEWSYEI